MSLRALEAMQPMHIEIALKAMERFHHQQEITNRQWQLRLDRAGYEAALAQRRYEKVFRQPAGGRHAGNPME